ncbi:hypothetical protein CGLAMM_07190 [Acetobacteraceae bacterium EV16G]|uniref:Uncharacterized protein n=1 Tax=Sorlinia euscelidii TaxID=3081148 RepID=A0ABU7U458_9PROT
MYFTNLADKPLRLAAIGFFVGAMIGVRSSWRSLRFHKSTAARDPQFLS